MIPRASRRHIVLSLPRTTAAQCVHRLTTTACTFPRRRWATTAMCADADDDTDDDAFAAFGLLGDNKGQKGLESAPSTTKTSAFVYSGLLSHRPLRQSDELCMDYARGWAWQQYLLHQRLAKRREDPNRQSQDADAVLLLEHAPVYTLGRGADENHLTFLKAHQQTAESAIIRERLSKSNRGADSARLSLDKGLPNDVFSSASPDGAVDLLSQTAVSVRAPNGASIYRVERGGEVTFHGPGQLVVYPLLDLQRSPFKKDLHWYLRMVEQVVIETLLHYNIYDACRDDINTGVWVGPNKVAAVGVSSSRWITTHGFAVNVCPDLKYFDTSVILPCGVEQRGVTSIAEILESRGVEKSAIPTVQDVARVVIEKLQTLFAIQVGRGRSLK